MKLLEYAARLEVPTHINQAHDPCGDHECSDCYSARPLNDIAMDVLAKLPPGQFKLIWHGYPDEWVADDGEDADNWLCRGTFIEAVEALCERMEKGI